MPTNRQQFCCSSSKAGFSLVELIIVVAIFIIVAAIAVPSASALLNRVKLRGAAQQLADLYQEARMKAVQDDTYYEVLVSADSTRAYVDVNGDGTEGDLTFAAPSSLTLSNAGVPAELDAKALGFSNFVTVESSTMYDSDGINRPGIAWSSRGFPCQRSSATSPCQPGTGWVQYLQHPEGGGIAYAAVSVSPSGRVRVWNYEGGAWR
ncbi:MAG TPA: prepilin-type N-terminal cleavage/methylation domain-containing protein [Candidatus Angelobacter sp.]|nr:prepilin-type N-terminal cleavage/methylation domain-containing protein [Candidatus Angelobacter sp.]